MVSSDDSWFSVITDVFGWMVVDGIGCLQIVLGGFKWFSIIYSVSSYGGIRCFKFKRSRQLWGIF